MYLVNHIGLHILRLIKLANDFAKVKITAINILLSAVMLPTLWLNTQHSKSNIFLRSCAIKQAVFNQSDKNSNYHTLTSKSILPIISRTVYYFTLTQHDTQQISRTYYVYTFNLINNKTNHMKVIHYLAYGFVYIIHFIR